LQLINHFEAGIAHYEMVYQLQPNAS
jgi:hypothetical protein